MMSQPFPLLSLPPDVATRALKQFNCIDLIDFALCSKRCKRTVQELSHLITGIELSLMESNSMIMIKSGTNVCGYVDFESSIPDGITQSRFICKTEVFVCKTDVFYYCRGARWIPIIPMTNYLMEIFKAPLHISLISSGYDYWLFLKQLGKCESLVISGSNAIAPHNLKCVVEHMKVNGSLILNVRHNHIFYPPELPAFFDVDNLEMMGTAEWITNRIFLNLYCRRIRLSFCHLKSRDFEDFVSQWYFSNNSRLEYVEVWFKVSPGVMHFKHFRLHQWDPYRRAQFYNTTPCNFINCELGYDIIRNDGVVATILIFSGSFHFIVWKNRFPPYGGNFLPLV